MLLICRLSKALMLAFYHQFLWLIFRIVGMNQVYVMYSEFCAIAIVQCHAIQFHAALSHDQ